MLNAVMITVMVVCGMDETLILDDAPYPDVTPKFQNLLQFIINNKIKF